jgi:hypothetical protein
MVRTINLTTDVPADHQVRITLPNDVPIGPAEMVIVVASRVATEFTLGDLARSPFFGMWQNRTDISDSVEFARHLRAEAWSRTV